MHAAGAVTIVARRPDRPRARLLPGLDDPGAPPDHRRARRRDQERRRDRGEERAGRGRRRRHQREPRRAVSALEGLLVKKAGMEDAVGLVDGALPRRRRAGPARLPREPRGHAAADRRGLHEGHADARAARPRGADRRWPTRPARCCATSRAAASTRGCCTRRSANRGPSGCSARRSSAATRRSSTSSADIGRQRAQAIQERRLMQTPAPFGYERATSVDDAIATLQRLGSEARVIAGGHSLLPMMKLRLANPEHLVDINDLTELALHPRGGGRDPDRRADPARRPAQVRAARRALPALPRRRGGDRRPGRAQPRHDRRLAVPGRRRRGPLGRLLGGKATVVIRGAERRARRRDGGLPRRPVHDRGRRRRDAHRGPAGAASRARAARTRRSSAARATGRSPPRRRPSGSTAA